MSDAEKARRGTLEPGRARDKAASATAVLDVEPGTDRDYIAVAQGYVAGVLDGSIVAGEWVKLACERHRRDMAAAESDDCPFIWSDEHAEDACEFIERLPHVEGKWSTENLIRLQPCQVFWVCSLFGWRQRADDSLRRFTTFYLELGRKGAKSTLMAAISFFHLLKEQEPGASVVCGATTGAQARIVFGIMQRMVRASGWLRDVVEALANAIITADGTVKPINAKASTQDGLNPSCIVLDESHAQKFGLHDVLKSAQGARPNPLLLAPTTAGYDLLSVGYALRTHVTKVLQGVFAAEHLFGMIYTIDAGDDWRDEASWAKANPMIGITPKLDWVRKYCMDAQQTPGTEGEFRVKVCSEWMQSSSSWLSMTAWDACADTSLKLEDFKAQPCWVGCDLAQLDDLAAVALVFEKAGTLYGFVKFYLPRDVVEARARVEPAYRQWALDKILTLTDGEMIDNSVIEADIRGLCKLFQVKAIVFDQFGSYDICQRLEKDGLPAVIEPKNAKTFTPPARELETRVVHGRFKHDGNGCLRWNASNCVVDRRIDDSILPKKEAPESPNKVDGIDALLEAMGAWLRKPASKEFRMLVLGGGR